MRFCLLASGSAGNAVYVESGGTRLLVDGGLSGRELADRLGRVGADPASLAGIVVSHEHADHVLGVGVLARRYRLPVYIHPRTLEAAAPRLGRLDRVVPFRTGESFPVGSLRLRPFPVPHDAVRPVGFLLEGRGRRLGLATDMGFVPALVRERLRGCHALVLESNHDPDLLRKGPYTWPLKQRILGRNGHLSNQAAAALLRDLLHPGLQRVVLAHLSQVNNLPELAMETAGAVLGPTRDVRLETAGPQGSDRLLRIV